MSVQTMKRQRGVALAVALMLLLVITVLAISAMSSSRMQLVMAGNTQFSILAFQAAQTAIETRFAEGGFTTDSTADVDDYEFEAIGSTAQSTVSYRAATDVPAGGYSLGAGFQAYHFEITATATAPRGATSSQVQGLYIVGPGG